MLGDYTRDTHPYIYTGSPKDKEDAGKYGMLMAIIQIICIRAVTVESGLPKVSSTEF
jgi:hypothetical protein